MATITTLSVSDIKALELIKPSPDVFVISGIDVNNNVFEIRLTQAYHLKDDKDFTLLIK